MVLRPRAIPEQEHRLNQIEARKSLVKIVQIYCAATKKQISKSGNSTR